MKLICFDFWQAKAKSELGRQEMAVRLRLAFIQLGVTFIKLGQFLAVRRDVIPLELVSELALLQDQVPPFAFAEAKAIVESELDCQLDQCFAFFDQESIASASIGQVHRAGLKDGRVVAVKVQRSNLVKTVKQDLALMHFVLCLIKVVKPKSDWKSWSNLIDEFGRTLFVEMDYLQEGRNASRLRNVLRPFPMIVIPRILWHYTTKFVITEEFCPGIKIDKLTLLSGIDLKRLAKCLVEAYLVQILEYGYFHADPHAGNLAISTSGQLIIYDFGMMGYITGKQRIGLVKLISSIAENKISVFVDSLADLGFISANSTADKNYLQELIAPMWVRYHSPAGYEIDLSEVEREVDIFLLNRYFTLPPNLAYLIRMIVALEAIVRMLNPNLNFLRVAAPYFKKIRGQLRYN